MLAVGPILMKTTHYFLALAIVAAVIVGVVAGSPTAQARTVDPGSIWVGGGIGPGIKMPSELGGSSGYFLLDAFGEYAVDSNLSGVLGLNLGLADTKPLRLRVGGRYRLTDLNMAFSPYLLTQLSWAKVFDVLGANLQYIGIRAGVGTDYFLTRTLAAGVMLGMDIGMTISERPAFYGTWEILLTTAYSLPI